MSTVRGRLREEASIGDVIRERRGLPEGFVAPFDWGQKTRDTSRLEQARHQASTRQRLGRPRSGQVDANHRRPRPREA